MISTGPAREALIVGVLGELSKDLLHLAHRRDRVRRDPFRTALDHYRFLGDPPEIGRRWRQALVRDHDREILQRLDRDLLLVFVPLEERPAVALPAVGAVMPVAVWPTTVIYAGPFSSVDDLDALTDAVVRLRGVLTASVVLGADGMAYVHVTHALGMRLGAAIGPLLGLAQTLIAGVPAGTTARSDAVLAA